MTSKTYAPSFPIARLERRTSAKGHDYFTGFLGGARITLLKSTETGRDGAEVWHLMLAEGKLYPLKGGDDPKLDADNTRVAPSAGRRTNAKGDFARPSRLTDDAVTRASLPAHHQEIPF